jgi:exopolysaccharide biosynthesis polyprenyl glycosylphosphotransferase
MATHGTDFIEELFVETGVPPYLSGEDGSSVRFHKPATSWPVLFASLDVLSIWSASFVAVLWHLQTVSRPGTGYRPVTSHLGFLLLYSGLVPLFSNTQRLYSPWLARSKWEEMVAVGKAALLATILLTACIYISGIKVISREVIFTTMLLSAAFMIAWRLGRREWVRRAAADGISCHNVLIVGTQTSARYLRDYLDKHPQLGYRFIGYVEADSDESPSYIPDVLGTSQQLVDIARANFVDHVIVCAPNRETVKDVLYLGREHDLHISVLPDLYDGLAVGAPVHHIGMFPLIAIHQKHTPTVSLLIKRVMDVVLSATGLIVLAPVLIAIAVAIKLTSTGPIFYTSNRVGKKGNIFGCHKFRTMVTGADALKETLHHLNERDGVLFKITNDPRITRVGRFLRKYSLDEIPQLWNVFKGNMSLVGPRPPIASEVQQYELEHLRRLDVTPGITGLWQVEARNNPSFESYIALDLEYVERWSLLTDLKILFKTAQVVLHGTGS